MNNVIEPTKELDTWEAYEKDLTVEYEQCIQEGKAIEEYKELFSAVAKMPQSKQKVQIADALFQLVLNAEQREDYGFVEPSDYESIVKLGDGFVFEPKSLDKAKLPNKIKGAWVGRICGCLLGKPIEGIDENDLAVILNSSGNNPMHRYITSLDITDEVIAKSKYRLTREHCWADKIDAAPADDDTNYTVMALMLIEKYGSDFTSENIARLWSELQPKYAYCTAERVAFLNYEKGYLPPNTALYKNPYREWIGAQIRADFFGYINPGNPKAAAQMAYRDACISHVKNGIYGEMFVAAMIAAAFACDDMKTVIRAGLSQIPHTSRLYKDVTDVIGFFDSGKTYDECWRLMREKYPSGHPCSWCHTNSNAMIVVMSLLYNGSDYGKAICSTVQSVYDTDCNGATVGSILGAMNGIDSIPEQWKKPINGKLRTSIFGYECVSVDELVEKTIKLL